MNPDQAADLDDLELPASMRLRLERQGWIEAQLHASAMAFCLSARVKEARRSELDLREPFQAIALAARSIRQAAVEEGLNLPIVVVLELGNLEPALDLSFRDSFDRWAGDQDWHRGDFALYLIPPVVMSGAPDGLPWMGPTKREEMVGHLLGPGPTEWQLTQIERSSVTTVAQTIEGWVERADLSRSSLHGDLLLTLAAALRQVDRERREGSSAPTGAVADLIDGSITRSLLGAWPSQEER
jgi:hypothetical protein